MTRARVAVLGAALFAGWSLVGARPAAASPIRLVPVAPPSHATEIDLSKALCGGAGAVGTGCGGLPGGGGLLGAGLPGDPSGAVSTALGAGAGTLATSATKLGLAVIGSAVVGAAAAVLKQAASTLGNTTAPQLQSTWFSTTYWRMGAIAAVLTLPFLFAATVQAALRSDVALLTRAAFGYLPLAMLSIAIAAPLTSLLLAASDQLCGLISATAGHESAHVLAYAASVVAGVDAFGSSPFFAILLGLFAIGAAFALWIELLLREAAVYVVVLMLPLAFAALAWPARRVWAVRGVEILVALILSKFAIVAVLSLGGSAIAASVGHADVSGLMAGTVLIMLAAVSPWALLRFVPLAEVAASAAGAMRADLRSTGAAAEKATGYAKKGSDWVVGRAAEMNREASLRMAEADGRAAANPSPSARDQDAAPAEEAAAPSEQAATPAGHAAAPAGQAAPPTEQAAEPDRARASGNEPRWSERSILELGPGFGDTPVWPHSDAE